jgi:mRNA interferase RelE/StbE
LRSLDPHIRRIVARDLLKLEEDPRPHGVEKLESKQRLYRVYVGPGKSYRAIYQIQDEILLILVVRIGHRKEVYRRL